MGIRSLSARRSRLNGEDDSQNVRGNLPLKRGHRHKVERCDNMYHKREFFVEKRLMRYIKILLREKAVPTLLDRGSTFETLEIFVGGAASPSGATPRNALNCVDRKSFDLRVLPLSLELSTYVKMIEVAHENSRKKIIYNSVE